MKSEKEFNISSNGMFNDLNCRSINDLPRPNPVYLFNLIKLIIRKKNETIRRFIITDIGLQPQH